MSVRVLANTDDTMAVLYCSTTMHAFGMVIYDHESIGAEEIAWGLLRWLRKDARQYNECELESFYYQYLSEIDQEAPITAEDGSC